MHEHLIPNQLIRDERIASLGDDTVRRRSGRERPRRKAHGLGNLYVVDTSFLPSSSAVNPALTAMADALRVGRRYGAGRGALDR